MIATKRLSQALIGFAALGLVSGCGGGSDAPPPPPPPTVELGTPTLALSASSQVKQIRFTWASVSQAQVYRLWRSPAAGADFAPVGADMPASTTQALVDVSVHLTRWAEAQYRLQACDASGSCKTSAAISASDAMVGAIGYVKSPTTGADQRFGQAMALSADGHTLAVSEGTQVQVYSRTADQGWSHQQTLTRPTVDNFQFGTALSISADGNHLAVGSPNGADVGAGYLYLYSRTGTSWAAPQVLQPAGLPDKSRFAHSVALSGDGTAVVAGAPGELNDAGAAYVFRRGTSGSWASAGTLRASNREAGDTYGFSVAINRDGTRVAVGAPMEASALPDAQGNNGAANAGAVYVHTDGGAGVGWGEPAYLKATQPQTSAMFGYSVALSDNGITLAAGAPMANASEGTVQVYTYGAGHWSTTPPIGIRYSLRAGESLALSADGNTLAFGSTTTVSTNLCEDTHLPVVGSGDCRSGSAWVLQRAGAEWVARTHLMAPNARLNNHFGFTLSLSADGGTLAVGATGESSNATGLNGDQANTSAPNAGAVYLY